VIAEQNQGATGIDPRQALTAALPGGKEVYPVATYQLPDSTKVGGIWRIFAVPIFSTRE
jgi:hypothetical protein